jgi:hypothetical protein
MHGEHGIITAFPSAETRKTKPLRQLMKEDLLTLYVSIMTRKNDGAQPLTEVHDPSFSL